MNRTPLEGSRGALAAQVDGRTVRRWIEGTRPTPNVVIEHFRGLVDALDQTAQAITRKMGFPGFVAPGFITVFAGRRPNRIAGPGVNRP